MRQGHRLLLSVVVGLLVGPTVSAQALEFSPGTRYDRAIPTLKQVVGHAPGERITTPEQIGQYLRALHAAAPDRTRLIKYGESWERRDLHVLVVGSSTRVARIDEIKAGMKRLASGSPADAESLVRDLPVIVSLIHGVHGNEISSAEAALQEAYHLLAAEGDPVVDQIRREVLVLIDPIQNPDGRARFVLHNLLASGPSPDPEPLAAERDEPWPGGRSNHYLFDLNRDWFAQTQLETRARVDLMLDWMPQVVADLHEMGGNSTYYFPPTAPPANPHRTPAQTAWLEKVGRAIARRFDERGFAYFNREVYDSFYPGYGVSWPTTQGAIGMTFEKASARGLVLRRRDGSLLTYLDGAVEHFTAALATLAMAAQSREQLLRDFLEFRRTAGQGPTRAYLLPVDQADPGQVRRLVRTLLRNGISVRRAEEPLRLDNRTLPAGTFVVPLPQPGGMLARNLLDPQVPMNEAFLKQQEERRRRRLSDRIYDVTAWNLPMLYDVECLGTTAPIQARLSEVRAESVSPAAVSELPELPEAAVGYAVRWSPAAAALTVAALRRGYRGRFVPGDFRIDVDGPDGPQAPLRFTRGTVIFRRADNYQTLKTSLAALAKEHDVTVVPLESAFIEDGVSPGSNQAAPLSLPRVLLLWDSPTSSLSAGWARYVLEQRYGLPVTLIRTASLARIEMRDYDVLVMPSGNYAATLNGDTLRRLRDWIGAGGTLITIGEATRWAAAESTALLETKALLRSLQPESVPGRNLPPARPDAPPPISSYESAIQPVRELPEPVPGSLLRLLLDGEHWLSSGTDLEIQALAEGNRFYAPIRLDKGSNVGVYAASDRLLVSGLLWPGSASSIGQTPYLIHQPLGQGHLIAFTEDPNFRAFAEATQLLFINSLLLGTGF